MNETQQEKNEKNLTEKTERDIYITLTEATKIFDISRSFIYQKVLPILRKKENAVFMKNGVILISLRNFIDVLTAFDFRTKTKFSFYPIFLTPNMLKALSVPEDEIKDALRKCPSGIFLSEKLFFRGKDPVGLFLFTSRNIKKIIKQEYFVFPIRGLGTDLGYICYDTLFTTSLLNFCIMPYQSSRTSIEHLKTIISLFSVFLAYTTIGDASLKQRMEWQDEVYHYLISKVNELSKMVSEEKEEVQDSINKVQEILKEIEKEYLEYKETVKKKFEADPK